MQSKLDHSMAQPAPRPDDAFVGQGFSVRIEPPLQSWDELALPLDEPCPTLARLVDANARRSGSAPLARQGRRWVTGHQAWLWHPGILAKDVAAAAAANAWGGQVLHLVVDHDVHEALSIELPLEQSQLQSQLQGQRQSQQLSALPLTLAPIRPDLPAACQAPADLAAALATLQDAIEHHRDALVHVPHRLIEALQAMADSGQAFDTLGQQMTALTARLLQPWTGPMAMLRSSQMHELPAFKAMVAAMLADATGWARAYNKAVLSHPQAGIGPLAMDRQFVELPLWLLSWRQRRQAVYADITDSHPILVTADGSPVHLPSQAEDDDDPHAPRLAPRALMLTAVMRAQDTSLFVHGTGGGIYDQATEAWMKEAGKRLPTPFSAIFAPMAVATADLRLPFDAPAAGARDIWQARQALHHLSHNLNRLPGLQGKAATLAQTKAMRLEEMGQASDKKTKARLFREIHAINDELALLLADHLDRARAQLAQAVQGQANRAIAMRRDWMFPAYPDEALAHLRREIERQTLHVDDGK